MTDSRNCHEVATRSLVYEVDESIPLIVRHDLAYRGSGGRELPFDLYLPAQATRPRVPVVLLTTGFRDIGMRDAVGCAAKEMQSYRSWARLIAGTGIAAVTYVNHEPTEDARRILEHLHGHGESLQIDARRIGLWSCSGNVPNALSLLMAGSDTVRCAALLYGYMLDLDGNSVVADASHVWHFANPAAGRGVEDLPPDLPVLLVRAGQDAMAGLNESIDRFAARALALNRPVTVVNLHSARHAFDTVDATPPSRHAIVTALQFLRHELAGTSLQPDPV